MLHDILLKHHLIAMSVNLRPLMALGLVDPSVIEYYHFQVLVGLMVGI
jgi:hypothetical protein